MDIAALNITLNYFRYAGHEIGVLKCVSSIVESVGVSRRGGAYVGDPTRIFEHGHCLTLRQTYFGSIYPLITDSSPSTCIH